MTPTPVTADELISISKQKFAEEFGCSAEWTGCAPGRVNLIGEHTDYNEGFVLPMALPLVTVLVGRKTDSDKCRIVTTSPYADEPHRTEFLLPTTNKPLKPGIPKWANYVKGVFSYFEGPVVGFDAVISTTVPIGGGLSSSASLEVATYSFLEAITGYRSDLKRKALLCQKAEHAFANMPCGIMDQFISVLGKVNNALLLDCRSLEFEYVPISSDEYVFLIVNSNVHHELSGSEYSERRATCQKVASLLNKNSLRDASLLEVQDLLVREEIDIVSFKRARHAVTEIERTRQAADSLKVGNYTLFGELMNASHESLRDDYEVSCDELDELVTIAQSVPGVLGSRMTGGGFGGCTVSLVKKDAINAVIRKIEEHYRGNPSFFVGIPSDGARIITLS